MKIITIISLLLLSSVSFGQEKADTVAIYITDGFDNDSVDFLINDIQILKDQNLESNPYYGLTGDPILLIQSDSDYIVYCTDYENCNNNTRINVDDKIKLKFLFNQCVYEEEFDLSKGRHIIIGYVGVYMDIDIWQLNHEPGFE